VHEEQREPALALVQAIVAPGVSAW
jgi:hypothetical protein